MHEQKGLATSELSPVGLRPTNAPSTRPGFPMGTSRPLPEAAPMRIRPEFCPEGVDPFSTSEWELRSAFIKDENGKVLFEQKDCEIPAHWSPLATNVVVSKYFYGEHGTSERETSVRQVINRVARTIADWGIADGYFASREDGENFYNDLAWLCLHQYGSFNSPVWFNVGLYHQYGVAGSKGNYRFDLKTQEVVRAETSYEYPQASACFIQSVDDNMEDIMRLATSEAMLFKFGSGTGTDLSSIRSAKEKLSGGGTPSGPLSFMRVYDQIAAVVKSGGKTRRAAKMQSLKDWHPDILEFIQCKLKEEKKARVLIESGEYDSNFNGEAYGSIMYQNANLSVRLSDEFMRAYEENKKWVTHWVTDATKPGPAYEARYVMRQMAEGAWHCGDPGVQFDTIINRWHTCPNDGRINASNPCSEYMFLDDTACNLASLNLRKFQRDDGRFDVERYRSAINIFLTAQEILVDHASYPTPQIAANSHKYRPLGLGYANLGSLLMSMGIPYDSAAGRGICGALTSLLTGQAYLTSSRIAAFAGPFEGYRNNADPMLRVMRMHRDAVDRIDSSCPEELRKAAEEVWDDVVDSGRRFGFRNSQATVLAPTGTIAFMMDCDTTGIEPDIALVKYKQLAGGGLMKIVNRTVPLALKTLGYDSPEVERIVKAIEEHDTIEAATDLSPDHLAVFDCAFKPASGTRSIQWRAHIKMMAAAQPFLSGAISKTVNMPADSTVEDIEKAYAEGWRLGLKALAVYRDGSKQSQPLNVKKGGDGNKEVAPGQPVRRRLPTTRHSLTHKFSVGGHEGYITVGLFEDATPGELFISMAKEGSTIGGLMDVIGTETSMCLQYGVPLEVLVEKFSHSRFEPSGWTQNPDIPNAKSVVDYIFRWMAIQFMPGFREANVPRRAESASGEEGESAESHRVAGAAPATPAGKAAHGLNGSLKPEIKGSDKLPASLEKRIHAPLPTSGTNGSHTTNGHTSNGHASHGKTNGSTHAELHVLDQSRSQQFSRFQTDAPACSNCGSITVRNGACYLCHNCGTSLGCS
ncbi:Vitamin B12-dependent ribonucleotide reductase [Planctopirus ephydatiae]|uniref:Vitamin B12-dependent ribonucleotide reductase n=2 Tax=Planctopirus ephydatiae TaxID=2528019 RepID=A0A518GTP4_9PLAN|nr:vitamin B12-dependent ribonucleotide reductase [Planctopirus ephydatiae]QDV31957.1 Vitamin B12-dependent ribonucleotide reductase [Planctopirus ephydatiae]